MSNPEQEGREAAESFRCTHQLGEGLLVNIPALIERTTQCIVTVMDAPESTHGLTMRDPETERSAIAVTRTPNPMRQRSTLAHELAHVIFRDTSENLAERSAAEVRADAFARHLLVPQNGLKLFLGSQTKPTLETLSNVVQHFLVSPQIASIALREAGIFTQEHVERWKNIHTPELASRCGWSAYYRALQAESNTLRNPQPLIARAINAYSYGLIPLQLMASLWGLTEDEAQQELDKLEVRPQTIDPRSIELSELPDVNIDLSDLEETLERATKSTARCSF